MKKIILIGGGGHCKSVIDVIEQGSEFEVAGIVDNKSSIGNNILGYKVIGNDSDLELLVKKYKYAFITVGHIKSADIRKKLFNLVIRTGFKVPQIISPGAYISKHSSIGVGTIIMNGVIINAGTSIGDNCIINSKALVEHDCLIKDHCHISTNATLNGGVIIDSGSFIGSGAIIRELVTVQNDSFIRAGTLLK